MLRDLNSDMRRVLVLFLVIVAIAAATLYSASLWLAKRSEARYPPIGQYVEVDGKQIHYIDSGEPVAASESASCSNKTPVLVLLHGASTSLLDFETSLRPELQEHYRVLAFDRPGHGYSERESQWPDPNRQAAIIRTALQTLGIEHSLWIGHSWSGSVVLAGLLNEKEHVQAGVLISGASHPWLGGSAWHAELAARPLLGPLFSALFIEPGGRLSLKEAIQEVFAPEPLPENYIENTGVTLSIRPRTYRNNADDLTRLSAFLEQQSTQYVQIGQPVLSLTGDGDGVVPGWNHDTRLSEQLNQLESVSFAGAGHAMHHTRTTEVGLQIKRFIDSLASDEQSTQGAPSAETCPEVEAN